VVAKDLDNEANAAFVEAFQAEYGRCRRSTRARASTPRTCSCRRMEKADPSEDPTPSARHCCEADFASRAAKFSFGPNHHPIQDIYVREVVKEGDVYTNRIIGVALEDHADAYAADCKM
jgi:branched-chain amino acid transport system substrate-binding protein